MKFTNKVTKVKISKVDIADGEELEGAKIQILREIQEGEEKDGKWIHKERYAGSCMRQFYVGDGLTQEDVKAEFKRGILKLTVPKKEALPDKTQNKYIAIEG